MHKLNHGNAEHQNKLSMPIDKFDSFFIRNKKMPIQYIIVFVVPS